MSRRNLSDKKSNLEVFCLEYDQGSALVSHSYFWIKELKKYFEEITVFPVHKGTYEEERGIVVHELGGGNFLKRVLGLMRLMRAVLEIVGRRKNTAIFHHMITEPLALTGIFFRLMGIRQTLWYSHSSNTPILRIGHFWVNSVVTPTRDCFPLHKSTKVLEVGHGIDLDRLIIDSSIVREKRLIILGRISRIKKIDTLLEAIYAVKEQGISIPVDLVGPVLDISYQKQIAILAKKLNLEVEFLPKVNRNDVPKVLNRYEYSFSGNPSTVDKSALESSLMGCFVISTVTPVQKLTGMDEVWKLCGNDQVDLATQILILEKLKNDERKAYRSSIVEKTRKQNDLNQTINKIAKTVVGATING